MRGEAVILSERQGQALVELLEGTIEGGSVLRNHELAEIVKGDSFLFGEVSLGYRCGSFSLFLLVFEEAGEILDGEILFHIVLQGFDFLMRDLFVYLLELQPALHQLHYALKLVKGDLSVVCVLLLTDKVHNPLELLVFLHSESAQEISDFRGLQGHVLVLIDRDEGVQQQGLHLKGRLGELAPVKLQKLKEDFLLLQPSPALFFGFSFIQQNHFFLVLLYDQI